jgi:hypothetical protein
MKWACLTGCKAKSSERASVLGPQIVARNREIGSVLKSLFSLMKKLGLHQKSTQVDWTLRK